jgi:hypothetical protein
VNAEIQIRGLSSSAIVNVVCVRNLFSESERRTKIVVIEDSV